MKPSNVMLAIQACISMQRPLFLWGAPGVGKSASVWQAASALSGDAGILFLDEMNSAPPQTQAALYQLVLDRRVGDYELPHGWHIVAAGNRTNDRGVVHRMPDPLVDRFFHVDFEHDLEDWCTWALGDAPVTKQQPGNLIDYRAALRDAVDIMGLPGAVAGETFYNKPAGLPRAAIGEPATGNRGPIRPEVVAFLRFRPEALHDHDTGRKCTAFSTPRGWEDVSRFLDLGAGYRDIEADMIRGRVGDGRATEFSGFLKLFREMITPDEVLRQPAKAPVPTNVAVQYALAEALARRATPENLGRVLIYARRLPSEYGACLVSSAIRINKELCNTSEYVKWCSEGR